MSAMTMLSTGNKWYSYSGVTFGDVSVPATIQLIFIPNTGLKDSYVQIQPYTGLPQTASTNNALGIIVKIDDVEVVKSQPTNANNPAIGDYNPIQLFIPRQSKLEIISINTTSNNTQERGCNVIGYYL